MKPVLRLLLTLVCLLTPAFGVLAQQQPSRLVVSNKTGATVELFAFVKNDWESRGRISAGTSMPVYNVANGQRFRATWGSKSEELIVKLAYDRAYGGWQQQWDLSDSSRTIPGATGN